MQKEYQPLSQEKEYRKAKPCNDKGFSFRANVNVRVYCIHPNNQIETREAGSKAREQERYYSIKPASSVLHDKGEVTERMRSNRGFEEAENGIRIASISNTGEARYYLTDQVDSVKVVVDKEGTTLNKFEYYPYGETWITEGEGNNNPKYNSQELDRETSFYFYNARHYDPEICRFVTADTIIDGEFSASGWNRYMYVGGNPIGYKDPTGHNSYLVTRELNAPIPGSHSFNIVTANKEELKNYDEETQKEFKKLSFKNKTGILKGYKKDEKVNVIIISGTKGKDGNLIRATEDTPEGKKNLIGDKRSLLGYIEGKKEIKRMRKNYSYMKDLKDTPIYYDDLTMRATLANSVNPFVKLKGNMSDKELDKRMLEAPSNYNDNVNYLDFGSDFTNYDTSANSNTYARMIGTKAGANNVTKNLRGYDLGSDARGLNKSFNIELNTSSSSSSSSSSNPIHYSNYKDFLEY